MKLRVVWVGKTKNPQLTKLCEDYIGRIRHFLPVDIAEVKDEAKLAAALDSSDRVIALESILPTLAHFGPPHCMAIAEGRANLPSGDIIRQRR